MHQFEREIHANRESANVIIAGKEAIIDQLRSQLRTVQEDLSTTRGQLDLHNAKQEEQTTTLSTNLRHVQQSLAEALARLADRDASLASLEHAKAIADRDVEKLAVATQRIAVLETEVQDYIRSNTNLQAKLAAKSGELAQLQQSLEQQAARLQDHEHAVDDEHVKAATESLAAQLQASLEENRRLSSVIEAQARDTQDSGARSADQASSDPASEVPSLRRQVLY